MRQTIKIAILLCLVFFGLGWFAVQQGWLTQSLYLTIASLVGTIASVIGLLTFSRPGISSEDLKAVEIESFAKLAAAAKDVEKLEGKKLQTQTDIEQLTRTKQEMDVLVRKAALSLFMNEELRRLEDRIVAHLEQYPAIKQDLAQYQEKTARLVELNEEIHAHKDADLLSEIIRRVRFRPEVQIKDIFQTLDNIWFFGPLLKFWAQTMQLQRQRDRRDRFRT